MMHANFRVPSLVPAGMAVHSADLSSDKLVLKISGTAMQGSCPELMGLLRRTGRSPKLS